MSYVGIRLIMLVYYGISSLCFREYAEFPNRNVSKFILLGWEFPIVSSSLVLQVMM